MSIVTTQEDREEERFEQAALLILFSVGLFVLVLLGAIELVG